MSVRLKQNINEILFCILVILLARVLATVTVVAQKEAIGIDFLYGKQSTRHQQILSGQQGNPWQYRILPDYIIELIKPLYRNTQNPLVTSFLELRLAQNFLIFLFAAIYYHKLHLSKAGILIGMNILAWSMTQAFFDSDLQFSTYFDVLFYLIAGILLLGRFYWLILLVTILAALNRETSALIPFFPLGYWLIVRPQNVTLKKAVWYSGISLLLFWGIYFGIRQYFGERQLITPYGNALGWETFVYNYGRKITYLNLAGTLGIVPIVALFYWKHWQMSLRAFFWIVVPIWFILHSFIAIMAETRLFLVPMAIVFIPASLGWIRQPVDRN